MPDNPELFENFYQAGKLGFDLRLVNEAFKIYKPFFKGNSALELGPATGYMTELLVNSFTNLTVVEGSKTLLDQIPEHQNIEKIHSLFDNFIPNKYFDTIIINHVLEHLSDPISILKKVYTWLSPGGVCIVGVPNAKSFHRLAAVKMGLLSSEYELNNRDRELGHFRVYDLDILRDQASKANFKIVKEGGIFLKFLSNHQIETLLTEEVIEAYLALSNDFYQNAAEIYLVLNKNSVLEI